MKVLNDMLLTQVSRSGDIDKIIRQKANARSSWRARRKSVGGILSLTRLPSINPLPNIVAYDKKIKSLINEAIRTAENLLVLVRGC